MRRFSLCAMMPRCLLLSAADARAADTLFLMLYTLAHTPCAACRAPTPSAFCLPLACLQMRRLQRMRLPADAMPIYA